MGKVKLREAPQTRENSRTAAESISLRPLAVAGVVVQKAELVRALQIYIPGLTDIMITDDGQMFWMLIGEGARDEDSTAK